MIINGLLFVKNGLPRASKDETLEYYLKGSMNSIYVGSSKNSGVLGAGKTIGHVVNSSYLSLPFGLLSYVCVKIFEV